jgi:ADP-ribosylglycohydrolase
MDLNSHLEGCLLGLAVGDMIGAPVEYQGQESARQYIKEHLRPLDFEGVSRTAFEELPFGHVTDDTQMANALVQAIIDGEGVLKVHLFRDQLVDLWQSDRLVGAGTGTEQALEDLEQTPRWWITGTRGGGNGAAMRVAPIGCIMEDLSSHSPYRTIQMAEAQSLPTHQSRESIVAAQTVALAVWQMRVRSTLDLQSLADWMEHQHPEWANHLRALDAYEAPGPALDWIDGLQEETPWDIVAPWAFSSVLWSLFAVQSTDTFRDTLERAVWCGGDVDTTGAMAGAIRGTQVGSEGIPDPIINPLRDTRGDDLDERIVTLSDRLASCVSD